MIQERPTGVRFCDGDRCEELAHLESPNDPKQSPIQLTSSYILAHISDFHGQQLVTLLTLFLKTYPSQICCPICHTFQISIFGIHHSETQVIFRCNDPHHPKHSHTFDLHQVNYLIASILQRIEKKKEKKL